MWIKKKMISDFICINKILSTFFTLLLLYFVIEIVVIKNKIKQYCSTKIKNSYILTSLILLSW